VNGGCRAGLSGARIVLRESALLPRSGPRALLAAGDRLEAAESRVHVRQEARLADLAVVHDIESTLKLGANGHVDGLIDPRAERAWVDWLAALLTFEERVQIGRARKAPDMRGEDSVRAPPHRGHL
jgi:hypothetical protein